MERQRSAHPPPQLRPLIVGRWQQSHTCDQLVGALNALGLGATAPGVV
jgi:hypothetical protein